MTSTKSGRAQQSARSNQEEGGGESNPKPLAATLMQEFQNLKDKFKNEDEGQEKGIFIYLQCIIIAADQPL